MTEAGPITASDSDVRDNINNDAWRIEDATRTGIYTEIFSDEDFEVAIVKFALAILVTRF